MEFGTPNVDNVVMHGSFGKTFEGTLCVTEHHVLLSSRTEPNEELWVSYNNFSSRITFN